MADFLTLLTDVVPPDTYERILDGDIPEELFVVGFMLDVLIFVGLGKLFGRKVSAEA